MDRRNFIKTAAWSVPVIAVAASVPMASASTEPQAACLRFIGDSAHFSKGYVQYKIQNKCNSAVEGVVIYTYIDGREHSVQSIGTIFAGAHIPQGGGNHHFTVSVAPAENEVLVVVTSNNAETLVGTWTRK